MRMRDVLWQIWLNCGYFLTVAASGFFLYKLCAPLSLIHISEPTRH